VLHGELTGLRALTDSDIEVFETELLADVETRVRATGRPWLPVTPGASDSPYRQAQDRDAAVRAGFVLEGTTRDAAWIDGAFADGVTLSLLDGEWSPAGRSTGR
jgi:hypothetical protein